MRTDPEFRGAGEGPEAGRARRGVGSGREGEEEAVRRGLVRAWGLLGVGALEEGTLEGQLLRPAFAAAAAGPRRVEELGDRFWLAALAVQLAHEASLVHDDLVDGGSVRRGRATPAEREGTAAALLLGDQLLARAYLAAARTGDSAFALRFARAVDRTIAGERAQGWAAGRDLDPERDREIARRKSGELLGCAMAAGAELAGGSTEAEAMADLGRDLGLLYQRVDDLLDFCPHAETGKPSLADHRRGLWTWPRRYLPDGAEPGELFVPDGAGVPAHRAVTELRAEGMELLRRTRATAPAARSVRVGLVRWLRRAEEAVETEVRRRATSPGGEGRPGTGSRPTARPPFRMAGSPSRASPPATAVDPVDVLARHGRSFHFASRLMPPRVRRPVARVYAFCRAVDDAVDRAPDPETAEETLARLHHVAREAYGAGAAGLRGASEGTMGTASGPGGGGALEDGTADEHGVGSLDRVMGEAVRAGVPFELVEKLFEGVRMDLRPRRFATSTELGAYTHRVAGVVGLWIARLAGCRDPWALEMADEMGRAMQLTNIVRDVGEDLVAGRLYLPVRLLERHRLDAGSLARIARTPGPVPPGFAAALEEVMGWADAGYGAAFQALPHLPPEYRRSVAVAARVYRGIHDEVRRNDYDTLRHRARTRILRKVSLAVAAHRALGSAERRAGGSDRG